MRQLMWIAAVIILAAAAYYILANKGGIRLLLPIAAVIILAAAAYHMLATMSEMRPLIWIAAGIILAAAAYYILATIGVLLAATLGFCCVESLILMSIGGIFVVAGLFAGALSLWVTVVRRRDKDGLVR